MFCFKYQKCPRYEEFIFAQTRDMIINKKELKIASNNFFFLSSVVQEQLLAELERIQLELDQLRGRPGSSYSRLDTMNL